jgi:uncharacterized protein
MQEQSFEETKDAVIVIEYDGISDNNETQFRQWQSQIRAGVRQFKGYLKTDICPPIQGLQDKWYIIVHFDSPANLGEWLDSDIRHHLVDLGKKKFGPYRYKIDTGLEGWFASRRHPTEERTPPAWKQNFAVLFGLYPTVMLETAVLNQFQLMVDWPLALRMFVNNLISCSLLTWVVMPLTTRLLNFWLKPAVRPSMLERSSNDHSCHTISYRINQINLIGTLLVLLGYGFMISIFLAFS